MRFTQEISRTSIFIFGLQIYCADEDRRKKQMIGFFFYFAAPKGVVFLGAGGKPLTFRPRPPEIKRRAAAIALGLF